MGAYSSIVAGPMYKEDRTSYNITSGNLKTFVSLMISTLAHCWTHMMTENLRKIHEDQTLLLQFFLIRFCWTHSFKGPDIAPPWRPVPCIELDTDVLCSLCSGRSDELELDCYNATDQRMPATATLLPARVF